MAVQGAHLTSTITAEDGAPSIFQVLAEESLVHTLQPTLKHLLRILAERNPHRYGFLYRYSEEVYLSLQLILENYYLKHHSASFSENFYGLKRSVIQQNGVDTSFHELPQSQCYRSLLFLVLVPYLKNKCDAYYEHLSATSEAGGRNDIKNNKYLNIKKLLCQAFLGAYPILHAAWETTMLAYQLAYIFGKSRFHTPFLKWAGVILQNLTEQDMAHQSTQAWSFQNKNWKEGFSQISSWLLNGLAIMLSMGLSVGVFFLQFLEWWYASDQKTRSITALPNPPPPQPFSTNRGTVLHTLCPLCQRVRTNDTVLAVSGFVFCYSCISKYISDNFCCPITKYPATHDHLVRLYLPDT